MQGFAKDWIEMDDMKEKRRKKKGGREEGEYEMNFQFFHDSNEKDEK